LQELFKSEVKRRGLQAAVRANKAGCLDACEQGPVVVIYPEGVWYRIRTDQDVLDVMNEHIERGRIVDRLVVRFDGGSDPA
jgi:(2Fe-2S) ferredoxin